MRLREGDSSGGGSNIDVTVTVRVRELVTSMMACDVNEEGPSPRKVGPRRFLIFCYVKCTRRSSLLDRQL